MVLSGLKFTDKHEWIKIEEGEATVGLTDYAQKVLGDITFIELPAINKKIKQSEPLSSVESVKAVSDIFAPISGEIIEVNSLLENSPELINKDPYGQGWICKLSKINIKELENLLSADKYENFIQGLKEKEK